MGVLTLWVSSHLPCVKAARQANKPERHKTKEREGKRGGTKERKKERKKGRPGLSGEVATSPVVAVENCLRMCREGLQVENDNHLHSAANLSALSLVRMCVCVSEKTAEGLPAGKV